MYTLSVHAGMNLLENLIKVLAVTNYHTGFVPSLPIVTSTKWALAALNNLAVLFFGAAYFVLNYTATPSKKD